jgi:hypothetical protein
MTEITWTPEELREFDRISTLMSSRDQMDRIRGRIEIKPFVAQHGKEKCDAMFQHLLTPPKRRRRK